MLPSAIGLADGFDPATLDVKGALTSDAINAADLAAGRWDGAALPRVHDRLGGARRRRRCALARGELGEVAVRGDALRGRAARPRRPARRAGGRADLARMPRPAGRPELPGRHGGADRGSRGSRRSSTRTSSRSRTRRRAMPMAIGRLRWIGGANSGTDSPILQLGRRAADAARAAGLRRRRPAIWSRSARAATRCSPPARAGSAMRANFRGEPHLPGHRPADPLSGGLGPISPKEKDDAVASLPWGPFARP